MLLKGTDTIILKEKSVIIIMIDDDKGPFGAAAYRRIPTHRSGPQV